jgi:hypothetical protein
VRDSQGDSTLCNSRFAVQPAVQITSNNVYVNKQIEVQGKGYAASSKVHLLWDGSDISSASTIGTNNKGSFSGAFSVPKCKHGDHNLAVSGGTNIIAFAMTMGIRT